MTKRISKTVYSLIKLNYRLKSVQQGKPVFWGAVETWAIGAQLD
jgi:hypothetical protein